MRSKFQIWLKTLLRQGLSEPEFYGDLVYKLKEIVGSNNVSAQFIKIISHHKKIGYNNNVLQQTACLVINPITVCSFAFLFNCTPVGRPKIYVSWSTSELRVRLARRKTGLCPQVKYFTDRSKAVLLSWIFYVFFLSCVCYAFARVCLYMPCGHLLGKGWPLGSCLWYLTLSFLLSHWYPGSCVVLDCIVSWSLHPHLLWVIKQLFHACL